MTPYLGIPVTEPSQVGEARRAAMRLAGEHGFDEVAAGRVALVVTELGTNLARHAKGGRLLIGCRTNGDAKEIEILSLDKGPGMEDVTRCLRDGFSTGGTPGTGLGAVRRLASAFSLHSVAGEGTISVARIGASPSAKAAAPPPASRFAHAGISLAAPGETVCGDAWALRSEGDKASVMVADGLGHGPVAAEAADSAIAVFQTTAGTPDAVLQRAHNVLRSTRGAAVAMAVLDATAGTVDIAGAGNIVGRLVSGVGDRSLLTQHGTLGVQIRRLQTMNYAWPDHALLVLQSDGIASRWSIPQSSGLLQCDPAVLAGWILRDHVRGRDDATVVVVRRS